MSFSGLDHGVFYLAGTPFSGLMNGVLYLDGVMASGVTDGLYYQNGVLSDGISGGVRYSAGYPVSLQPGSWGWARNQTAPVRRASWAAERLRLVGGAWVRVPEGRLLQSLRATSGPGISAEEITMEDLLATDWTTDPYTGSPPLAITSAIVAAGVLTITGTGPNNVTIRLTVVVEDEPDSHTPTHDVAVDHAGNWVHAGDWADPSRTRVTASYGDSTVSVYVGG